MTVLRKSTCSTDANQVRVASWDIRIVILNYGYISLDIIPHQHSTNWILLYHFGFFKAKEGFISNGWTHNRNRRARGKRVEKDERVRQRRAGITSTYSVWSPTTCNWQGQDLNPALEHSVFFYTLTQGHFFHCVFRERGRERNIYVRGKHQSVVSCTCPNRGSNPQPSYVLWLGMEPITFWYMGQSSKQLGHMGQGWNTLKSMSFSSPHT